PAVEELPPAREAGEHRGHVIGRAPHEPVGALGPESVDGSPAPQVLRRARDRSAPRFARSAPRRRDARSRPRPARRPGRRRARRGARPDSRPPGAWRNLEQGGDAAQPSVLLCSPEAHPGPGGLLMRKTALLAASTLALLTGPAGAQAPLPSARPEQVGLSTERLGQLGQVLRQEIAKGKIPGAVALVPRKGRIAYHEAFGARDPATRAPMTRDAIFRIYSM